MRYIRSLERKDIGLDTSMIPLGSCTMKLNAASEMLPITWPEFGRLHPFVPVEQAREFVQARPETQLDVIPPGPTPLVWLHGADSDPTAAQAAIDRSVEFINQSLRGG